MSGIKQLIGSLTAKQRNQMVEYREQCRAIGLSCAHVDRQRAEQAVTALYAHIGKALPLYCWFDGQMTAELAMNLIKGDNLLKGSLRGSLRGNLWGNLRGNLEGNLEGHLEGNLRDNLWGNLEGNLRGNLWGQGLKWFGGFFAGQMEMYWIAYYLFPHKYLRKMHSKEQMEVLGLWQEQAESCCWWWPFEKVCVMSERPLEIHMQEGQLHKDGGPAFVSRDGWKVWYLYGVAVSPVVAETAAGHLDSRLLLQEKNAEVRREIVRKIGVERICADLRAECIDESDGYQLLMLNLGDGRRRPYLKMRNPSIGIYHIEGVHPDCLTVEAALNWRNQTEEQPKVIA